MTWATFNPGYPVVPEGWSLDDDFETISIDHAGPRLRSAEELSAAIRAAGGGLQVGQNSSELIVAANNSIRFAIENLGNGVYAITDRFGGLGASAMLLGVGAVVLLLLFVKR